MHLYAAFVENMHAALAHADPRAQTNERQLFCAHGCTAAPAPGVDRQCHNAARTVRALFSYKVHAWTWAACIACVQHLAEGDKLGYVPAYVVSLAGTAF